MSRYIAAALLGIGLLSAPLAAQPKLEITSPKDGELIYSGQKLVVRVNATPPEAFQRVALFVTRPLKNPAALTQPPFEFEIDIPRDTPSLLCSLSAQGVLAPMGATESEVVSIKIEHPDTPDTLRAEPPKFLFDEIGQEKPFRIYGSFPDSKEVDLTYSSMITYVLDSPNIATVDDNTVVTSVGPGSAKLVIHYLDKSLEVPVEVRDEKRAEGAGR